MNINKLTSGKHDYFIPMSQKSALSVEVSRQMKRFKVANSENTYISVKDKLEFCA